MSFILRSSQTRGRRAACNFNNLNGQNAKTKYRLTSVLERVLIAEANQEGEGGAKGGKAYEGGNN